MTIPHMARGVVAVAAALGLGFGAGCVAKRVPMHEPTATSAPAPYDFEKEGSTPEPPAVAPAPASGRQESMAVSLETPAAADLRAPEVSVQELPPSSTPSPSAAPAPAVPVAPAEAAVVTGFRVQVFASAERESAERVRSEVEARLGEKAYTESEPPYYKVRIGNCRTEEACHALETRLRQAGYASIWIVTTRIEP